MSINKDSSTGESCNAMVSIVVTVVCLHILSLV